MRKKLLCFMLSLCLTISLLPTVVYAANAWDNLKSDIVLQEDSLNGKDGIRVTWVVNTGTDSIHAANAAFVYDSSVFELTDSTGKAVDLENEDAVDAAQVAKQDELTFDSLNKMYAQKGANNDVTLGFVRISAINKHKFEQNTVLGNCFLAYKDGKSKANVTMTAIRAARAEDMTGNLSATSSVIYMMLADQDSTEFYYGAKSGYTNTEGWEKNITFAKNFEFAKPPINKTMFTISDLSKPYNAEAQEPTIASTTLTADDYTVTYAVKGEKGQLTADRKPCGAGTYLVTISGAGKYGSSFTETFNITKKQVVITPDADKTKQYGEPDPDLTFTTNLDAQTPLAKAFATEGKLTYEGTNVGEYDIKLGTLTAGDNFELVLNSSPVKFKITAKNVTTNKDEITLNVVKGVGDFTQPTFGDVTGAVTYSYGDVKNGTYEAAKTKLATLNKDETGTISYTFTAKDNYTGTITGAIKFTVVDIEFKVDNEAASAANAVTVKNAAPVYGIKWSDIVALKNNITANVGGKIVTGTYKLSVAGDAIPNAGPASYNILFTSDDENKSYKDVKVFSADASIDVSKKPLTVDGAMAITRQYNGKTDVEVTGGELKGLLDKDNVDLFVVSVKGSIDDANVGTKKKVTVTGYDISEQAKANYELSQPDYVTVDITKKELTIASAVVAEKSYDGTTKATVTGVTFNEAKPLPDETGYTATAEFADAAVGDNKDVTVKVVLNDKNYNLADNTTTVKADITTADAVTIPEQKIVLKVGDGIEQTTQTVDLAGLMPTDADVKNCDVTKFKDDSNIVVAQGIKDGKWSFNLAEGTTADKTAEYTALIRSVNYANSTVTIKISTTSKEVPTVKVNDITVAYGTEVTKELIKGTANVNGTVVKGTFDWKEGVTAPTTVADSGNYAVTFTPEETDKYEAVTKTIKVTITPAKVTGTLKFGTATAGSTLGDIRPKELTGLTPSAGTFTWNDGDAQTIQQGKAYGWTFTPANPNYAPLTGTVTPLKQSSSGGSSSVVTTPEKAAKDFVKNSMSANGSTIKNVSKDNYKQVLEAADKYNKLSAAEKEAVDKEMKAQTGKTMAELIAEAEAIKIAEGGSTAEFDVQKAVKELTLKARSSKLKSGSVKIVLKGDLSEIEKNGYTVKYKFYRSTKKSASYKAAVTKDAPNYLNTAGKKGKMYYYKARVMVYDKDGNLVAKTELKQCKYANRTWTKK